MSSLSLFRLCWRPCGHVGFLFHMWWSCLTISSFSILVSNLILELTCLHLTLIPELVILDIDLHNISFPFKTLIYHILFAAHISTARHWKTPHAPSFKELSRRINLSCLSELTLTPFNPYPANNIDAWSSSAYYLKCCLGPMSLG